MTDTTSRPFHEVYDADTGSYHTVDQPFRIVAAQSIDADVYANGGQVVALGEPSDDGELGLLNCSYVELVATNVTTQPGYNAVAIIGPDADGVLPWLVWIEAAHEPQTECAGSRHGRSCGNPIGDSDYQNPHGERYCATCAVDRRHWDAGGVYCGWCNAHLPGDHPRTAGGVYCCERCADPITRPPGFGGTTNGEVR